MNNDEFITLTIGRIAMLYKGEYDSKATYSMLDCVSHNGSLYFCIKEATNKVPNNNKDYWITGALSAYSLAVESGFEGTQEEWLLSLKGEQGPKGDVGPKGDTGATGENGNGIASIEKTKTEGLVDTYTITYTDETTDEIKVTNGADFDERKLEAKLENYEKKHTYYSMTIKEEISAETEVEIPCSYLVGNDELVIFIDGIYLKCEKSEDDIANYREIGPEGTVSNKIQFGFNLEVGEELTFIVKGCC